MKFRFLANLIVYSGVAISSLMASSAQAALTTVPSVDPARYLGDWYQIAHIPLFFEGGPCSCTRQRLTLSTTQSNVVEVYNSCNSNSASGALQSISGEATPDDSTFAKLTVDFHQPFKGSYWIIGLDARYRYAVVSDANEYSLYILAKTPTLSATLYQEALNIATKQGLDISKLEVTDQKNCTYPK